MRIVAVLIVALSALSLTALPALAQEDALTIYSGRNESLIGPLLESFSDISGIEIEVLYGGTAGLASQIIEEGENSPADVFIAQDAGALGALAKAGLLAELPEDLLGLVSEPAFVSPDGLWLALSGRARVLVYGPDALEMAGLELPESILDLTGEKWRGVVGWAPTNGSFQANVTAMRQLLGDEATLVWLQDMIANDVQVYPKNTPIVQAVIDGEIAAGLVNHYYLFRFLAEDPSITAQLHWFPGGDPGALVNIAGAAIPLTSGQPEAARSLIRFMLGEVGQTWFTTKTCEYPVVADMEPAAELKPLAEIETPDLDLSDLDDLAGTLDLIEESGALDQ
ncbi:MAG: extracellular solute-binding protein [Anaerolineaceae bacterium]|nr:extracellular solute-binding protein [Anaerolineaceae bacterium]